MSFSLATVTVRQGAQVSAAFVERRKQPVLPNAMGGVNATTALSQPMTVILISPNERRSREGKASSSDSRGTSQPWTKKRRGNKGKDRKVMIISSEDESDLIDGKLLPELFLRAEDKRNR